MVTWSKAVLKISYSENGSSTPKLWVYDSELKEIYFEFEDIFDVLDYLDNLFKQNKNSPIRFNKVEFEVFKDGTYKADNYWDDGVVDEQKRRASKNMSDWLSQRIPTMISTQGYALYEQFRFEGDVLHNEKDASLYSSKKGWINGVFTFDFRNENLKITIEVEKITGRVELPIEFPDWFDKDLWEHHNITNNGLLSKDWKPWNVLEIKLEKDIGHQGGKSIEPEIRYMFI